MKSTTMRVRRALPIAIVSILAITIGAITAINIKSISDKASANTTRVEVVIQGEVVLPTISDISPNHGSAAGGTLLTFTGFNLNNISSITVGGAECRPVDIISPEEITCITTAHVPGPAVILLKSSDGTLLAEIDGAFTYDPIIPIPPETGGEDEGGGVLVPDTGMFLLGSSDSFTYLDYILVSFIVVAILGLVLYRMCIITKRKRSKKSTSKRKTTKKKSKK